jgi:protein gp37
MCAGAWLVHPYPMAPYAFHYLAAEFEFPKNIWMGTTVDMQARVPAAEAAFANVQSKVRWLSQVMITTMMEGIRY